MTPRQFRIGQGLSLNDMAEYCNVAPSTYSRWERGFVKSKSPAFVRKQIEFAALLLNGGVQSDLEDFIHAQEAKG